MSPWDTVYGVQLDGFDSLEKADRGQGQGCAEVRENELKLQGSRALCRTYLSHLDTPQAA